MERSPDRTWKGEPESSAEFRTMLGQLTAIARPSYLSRRAVGPGDHWSSEKREPFAVGPIPLRVVTSTSYTFERIAPCDEGRTGSPVGGRCAILREVATSRIERDGPEPARLNAPDISGDGRGKAEIRVALETGWPVAYVGDQAFRFVGNVKAQTYALSYQTEVQYRQQ
jgi:hypothetical protein